MARMARTGSVFAAAALHAACLVMAPAGATSEAPEGEHGEIVRTGATVDVGGGSADPTGGERLPRGDVPLGIERVRKARVNEVVIDDSFWNPRLRANRERTVWANLEQCERTGRIENLRRAGRAIAGDAAAGGFQGLFFNDSDVYKALEGACWLLAAPEPKAEPRLVAAVDELVGVIAAAQHPDGYINSYFTLAEPGKRFTNLKDMHELYCGGHLIEAAIAHHTATGDRRLLDVAMRFADLVCATFGAEARRDVCGHEEIELALFALAEHTGIERYRATAEFFLNERGRGAPPPVSPPTAHTGASAQATEPGEKAAEAGSQPSAPARASYGEYCQDHLPVGEQREVVGHAVRAMYLFTAVTHMARLRGDADLLRTMGRAWQDLTGRKTYITGGVGPSAHNEGFTIAYDLPNDTAYAETCAGIGSVLWNHEMLLATGDSRHADAMERALYNGVISGVSMSGDRFFYVNPLDTPGGTVGAGGEGHARVEWFGCACCPPNILRLLASLGTMVYSVADDGVWINLYAQSRFETQLRIPNAGTKGSADGRDGDGVLAVRVEQTTNYPWEGAVRVTVTPRREAEFTVRLRVPGFASGVSVRVNGERFDAHAEKGYVALRRTWKAGDTIEMEIPMSVERVYAHPAVEANRGRVALRRGPVVYCFESTDNTALGEAGVRGIVLGAGAALTHEWKPDVLGGCVVIHAEGVRAQGRRGTGEGAGGRAELGGLYQAAELRPVRLTAVPYAMWGNRNAGQAADANGERTADAGSDEAGQDIAAGMIVWVRETAAAVSAGNAPGRGGWGGWGASGGVASASHCWRQDRVEAVVDGRVGASSADESVPRMTFWPRRGGAAGAGAETSSNPDGGGREWVRLDFQAPEGSREVSGCEVYWFRDVPRGGCDVPREAELFALAEGARDEHDPVAWESLGEVGCEADEFNRVRFEPRRVRALRLDVLLKEGASAGVLEWRVE